MYLCPFDPEWRDRSAAAERCGAERDGDILQRQMKPDEEHCHDGKRGIQIADRADGTGKSHLFSRH